MKKFLKVLGIILVIFIIVLICGYFILMNNTQIIVGFIQNISKDQVNTQNLFEPLNNPLQDFKNNGQYIITEINYSKEYPNSYLDITYPDDNLEKTNIILFSRRRFLWW